jgi:hypothetical protein
MRRVLMSSVPAMRLTTMRLTMKCVPANHVAGAEL